MALMYEFMNEEEVLGWRRSNSLLMSETNQEFADLTALRGPTFIFKSTLL